MYLVNSYVAAGQKDLVAWVLKNFKVKVKVKVVPEQAIKAERGL